MLMSGLLKTFNESIFRGIDGCNENGYFALLKRFYSRQTECSYFDLKSQMNSYPAFWDSLDGQPLEISTIISDFKCDLPRPNIAKNLKLTSVNHVDNLLQCSDILRSVEYLTIEYEECYTAIHFTSLLYC